MAEGNTILKRVHLDHDLNYRLKEKAAEFGQNHHEFINDAVEHYLDFLAGDIKKEDFTTRRMSELTESVESLKVEVSTMNQSMNNRFDTIALFDSDNNYLRDE